MASGLLVERFLHRIRKLVPQANTSIHPVVFLNIEDIEIIVQNIRDGDFTFADCLREKLGHDRAHFYSPERLPFFNQRSRFAWGSLLILATSPAPGAPP